jgi:ATP synthase protein I
MIFVLPYFRSVMLFDSNKKQQMALAIGLTVQLVVAVLIGFYLGRYIDNRFETEPMGSLAGALLGFTAATITLIRTYNKMENR